MTNNEKDLSDKSIRIEYRWKYYTCNEWVELNWVNDINNVHDISLLLWILSVSLAFIFLWWIAIWYNIKNKSDI